MLFQNWGSVSEEKGGKWIYSGQLAISFRNRTLVDQNLIWKPVHETGEEGAASPEEGYRLPEALLGTSPVPPKPQGSTR